MKQSLARLWDFVLVVPSVPLFHVQGGTITLSEGRSERRRRIQLLSPAIRRRPFTSDCTNKVVSALGRLELGGWEGRGVRLAEQLGGMFGA